MSTAKTSATPSGLPVPTLDMGPGEMDQMKDNATRAASFLKAISHEGRLMILCHLSSGEKSVTELETLLSTRQAVVSQQLSRLRLEGLVTPRREGKAIYYSLSDGRTTEVLKVLYDVFCARADTPETS
ncbi:metalloregulator ArsR/SmtB family transcription factor [Rhodobacteraceae bacterium]|nr:metalloregulator ArsR/SmtB family transcription factor [Paracoccaceae bacterium]